MRIHAVRSTAFIFNSVVVVFFCVRFECVLLFEYLFSLALLFMFFVRLSRSHHRDNPSKQALAALNQCFFLVERSYCIHVVLSFIEQRLTKLRFSVTNDATIERALEIRPNRRCIDAVDDGIPMTTISKPSKTMPQTSY